MIIPFRLISINMEMLRRGPSRINRLTQGQNSQPKPQNNNSSSDNQETEQAPVANIFASVESGDVPLTVTFSNQGTASSLTWNFADGTASAENSPTHIFDKPGNYEVKLMAKNSNGSASASGKIIIEVKAISEIMYAPNVFSPNGDRVNDEFFFVLKNIVSVDVVISDMHGMLINKWNTLDGSWNGKISGGEDAPNGIYIYSIQATGTDGVIAFQKRTCYTDKIISVNHKMKPFCFWREGFVYLYLDIHPKENR